MGNSSDWRGSAEGLSAQRIYSSTGTDAFESQKNSHARTRIFCPRASGARTFTCADGPGNSDAATGRANRKRCTSSTSCSGAVSISRLRSSQCASHMPQEKGHTSETRLPAKLAVGSLCQIPSNCAMHATAKPSQPTHAEGQPTSTHGHGPASTHREEAMLVDETRSFHAVSSVLHTRISLDYRPLEHLPCSGPNTVGRRGDHPSYCSHRLSQHAGHASRPHATDGARVASGLCCIRRAYISGF